VNARRPDPCQLCLASTHRIAPFALGAAPPHPLPYGPSLFLRPPFANGQDIGPITPLNVRNRARRGDHGFEHRVDPLPRKVARPGHLSLQPPLEEVWNGQPPFRLPLGQTDDNGKKYQVRQSGREASG